MARGQGAPPVTVGRPCRKCGGDEWRTNTKGYLTCSPCMARRGNWSRRRTRAANPARPMWEQAKARAKRSGVPFTITIDDVRAAWPADGRCPVFGMTLRRGVGCQHAASPSLDRLNPTWGYEPGNVAVISARANRAKSDMSAHDLERIAAWMRRRGLD